MRLIQKHLQKNKGLGTGILSYQPEVPSYTLEVDNTMAGFPLVLDYDYVKNIKDLYEDVKRMALNHINSKAFLDLIAKGKLSYRTSEGYKTYPIKFFKRVDDAGNLHSVGFPLLVYSDASDYYDFNSNVIGHNPEDSNLQNYWNPWLSLAHEIGHFIDENHIMKDPKEGWIDAYRNLSSSISYKDIFDNSKATLDFIKYLIDNGISTTNYYYFPGYFYKYDHDGQPVESYADFISFLQLVNDELGLDIDDLRKMENTDRYLLLLRLRDKYPNFRFFKNFEIYYINRMIKEIAANNKSKKNLNTPLYIKKGKKLK